MCSWIAVETTTVVCSLRCSGDRGTAGWHLWRAVLAAAAQAHHDLLFLSCRQHTGNETEAKRVRLVGSVGTANVFVHAAVVNAAQCCSTVLASLQGGSLLPTAKYVPTSISVSSL